MLGNRIQSIREQLLFFGFCLSVAEVDKLPPQANAVLFVELP